ncbi:MAG: carbon-nitrogen hydrolase family protein [Polyangiaceae bacterium]|nr:carbon-nitrogen hydrolase family protein [Polyangiaceae bacterium]
MVDSSLTVAALQMEAQDDVPTNLEVVRRGVEAARARGARVILLPENFAFMGPEEGKRELAERLGDGGPIQRALASAAREVGIAILAGGFPERSEAPDRPYNACVAFDAQGVLRAVYRKIHLFDVDLVDGTSYRESRATSAGSEPVVVELEGFKFGLSVCYDLRFPELYRRLVDRGAEVLVVPAAFTLQTGKDHWHVLLRARAIEAQCWVLAAAQWGRHPRGRATYGHSLLADPWGHVVAEASDRPGLVVGTVDREYLAAVRARVPSLAHRRL